MRLQDFQQMKGLGLEKKEVIDIVIQMKHDHFIDCFIDFSQDVDGIIDDFLLEIKYFIRENNIEISNF